MKRRQPDEGELFRAEELSRRDRLFGEGWKLHGDDQATPWERRDGARFSEEEAVRQLAENQPKK